MKAKKMNNGGYMKDVGMVMNKSGKGYAAGGAAKVRLEECDANGNPISAKKKKK